MCVLMSIREREGSIVQASVTCQALVADHQCSLRFLQGLVAIAKVHLPVQERSNGAEHNQGKDSLEAILALA